MSEDGIEYRIEYTIQRRLPDDEDFSEIGFGSSGGWADPKQCAHILSSDIDNYNWETSAGMPHAAEIRADVGD